MVAVVGVALALSGCSNDGESGSNTTPSVQRTPSAAPEALGEGAPTSPLGGTLKVWNENQMAEYTVANPHRASNGMMALDLTMEVRQGNNYVPGTFFVLTDAGKKIEQFIDYPLEPHPDWFDYSGSMVAGERREGEILFDAPEGARVEKVILYHGTLFPPVAFWTA
ncbi:hypothetical protein GV791_09190 [Nocardia cyriacigeorgica]|uniref:DUF4352 domain-containing protein n=1 Tax=Nocardia cyriacigeorgica TaxID=135487 RepID=A0A6P1CRG2_9NOCA|nr:hypothetical protein [Nocardia cyriacigeorgica]NEW32735.1 hypothetical protein [Nocardia cyriacigeorgica]